MENFDRKQHWENIYDSKEIEEVSWFQNTPVTSLNFFKEFKIPLSAKIIDVGGGDSFLVDHLLDLGYTNITVLDISEKALEKAKKRLRVKSESIKWIVADASVFQPEEIYDVWHDRAAFHFLTTKNEIENYISNAHRNVSEDGILIIGTFSLSGPKKCSGIEIQQYSEQSMTSTFQNFFKKIRCINVDHKTPFNTIQNFIFCSFRKISN